MKYDEEEDKEVLKDGKRAGPIVPILCVLLVLGVFTMAGGFDGNVRYENSILSQAFDNSILSSLLSPARGISGEWTGSYFIETNMVHPDASMESGVILNIKQSGNAITGSYIMQDYRSRPITGTISSSRIDFTDGFIRFSGTFTTDLMKLNVESCSIDQYCNDPEKVGDTGSSSGVSYVYAGEPGIKGNIVLYKGSNNLMANTKSYSDIPDPYKPIGVYPEGYIP